MIDYITKERDNPKFCVPSLATASSKGASVGITLHLEYKKTESPYILLLSFFQPAHYKLELRILLLLRSRGFTRFT